MSERIDMLEARHVDIDDGTINHRASAEWNGGVGYKDEADPYPDASQSHTQASEGDAKANAYLRLKGD
jgi:hypothetical protein